MRKFNILLVGYFMLEEYKRIMQNEKGIFRRLFIDDFFELFVFYKKNEEDIESFQFVYDRYENPHVFTWVKNKGFKHNKIDDGEDKVGRKRTPIMVPDGIFKKDTIIDKFEKESKNIDENVVKFVISKLMKYKKENENVFL